MINFKLRLQNKATLVALISAVFLMLQQFRLEINIISRGRKYICCDFGNSWDCHRPND